MMNIKTKQNIARVPKLLILFVLLLVIFNSNLGVISSKHVLDVPSTHADDDDHESYEHDDKWEDDYSARNSNITTKVAAPSQPLSETQNSSTQFQTASETGQFSPQDLDLTRPDLAYYMDALKEMNVVSRNDRFYQQMYQPTTRGDTVRVLLSTAGIAANDTGNSPFKDVSVSDRNMPFIARAKQLSIIKGYEDGTFHPNESITRAEAIKVIIKTYGIDLDDKSPRVLSFKDLDTLHWASAYIEFAKANDILSGYPDGTYGVDNHLTSVELAKISLRAAAILQNTYHYPPMFSDQERNVLLANQAAKIAEQKKALAQTTKNTSKSASQSNSTNQSDLTTATSESNQPINTPQPPVTQPVDNQALIDAQKAAEEAAAQAKAAAEAAAKKAAEEAARQKAAELAAQAAANAQNSSSSSSTTTKRS